MRLYNFVTLACTYFLALHLKHGSCHMGKRRCKRPYSRREWVFSSAIVEREQAKLMQLEVYSLTSTSVRKEMVDLWLYLLDLNSLLISIYVSFSLDCAVTQSSYTFQNTLSALTQLEEQSWSGLSSTGQLQFFRIFQWDLSQVSTKCLWQLHFMRCLPTVWVPFWMAQAWCDCNRDLTSFHICTFGFKALSFLFPKQRQSNENNCKLPGVQWRLGMALAALPSHPCPWDTGAGECLPSLTEPEHSTAPEQSKALNSLQEVFMASVSRAACELEKGSCVYLSLLLITLPLNKTKQHKMALGNI